MVGSINMDLVLTCDRLPQAGETVAATSCTEVSGGKGANQAVAASLAGGQVRLIGRVGDDAFADRLRVGLTDQGVDCEHVDLTDNCESGLAVIGVGANAENQIMIVPGANGRLTPADILRHSQVIANCDVLLLQLEVPVETVLAAMGIAKQAEVRCILDPAPVAVPWTDELLNVDLVCPNETEASLITGQQVDSVDDAKKVAAQIQARGAKNVVITMGHQGCVVQMEDVSHHIAAPKVDAIDTTAAGDAFSGALAVHWAETGDLLTAVRFATVAGALATTRRGAQPSIFSRKEIEEHRSQI